MSEAQELTPFIVSRHKTAKLIDCSVDHVDDLVERGELEKVPTGVRKVGITMRSIKRLVNAGEAK
jgi:hypothetical protein